MDKRLFYYNAVDDVWQEEVCDQDNIEYRLEQLRFYDRSKSYVYLPMIWTVEVLPDNVVELILHTKRVTITYNHISEITDKEWTIDCDFCNGIVQGWPISITEKTERYWRNGYICSDSIVFPELLAARYIDIPAAVVDVAIEYLRNIAKDRFGFRPSYLGDAHGLSHLMAFCESPLDPNLYIIKDVLGKAEYERIKGEGGCDTYKELCKYFAIENPPPSLRKAYVMNPESILIYVYMRQCGFRDINIIRRFFYRETFFGHQLLKMRYDAITGMVSMIGDARYVFANFQRFCNWLLRNRSEKAIAPRVLRWCNESLSNDAIDTLRMFTEARLDLNDGIVAPAVRRRLLSEGITQEVHDILMEELFIVRPAVVNPYPFMGEEEKGYKLSNITYEYKKNELGLEKALDEYTFHLPKETNELRKWGNLFHNCVASYDADIIDKISLIVAMKEQGKFVSCIEIRQGRITQALGYCNQRLELKYRDAISEWAKANKLFYGHKPMREPIRFI